MFIPNVTRKLWSHYKLQFLRDHQATEDKWWHIWNPEKDSGQKHVLFIQKYSRRNLTLFDLTLTWPPLQMKSDDVKGFNEHFYWNPRAKRAIKHASHGIILVTYLIPFVTWPWPWPFGIRPMYSCSTILRHMSRLWVSLSSMQTI